MRVESRPVVLHQLSISDPEKEDFADLMAHVNEYIELEFDGEISNMLVTRAADGQPMICLYELVGGELKGGFGKSRVPDHQYDDIDVERSVSLPLPSKAARPKLHSKAAIEKALTIACPNLHCKAKPSEQCKRGLLRGARAQKQIMVHPCRQRAALGLGTSAAAFV